MVLIVALISPVDSFTQMAPQCITQMGDDARPEFANTPSEVQTLWRCGYALDGIRGIHPRPNRA
jgi:hypothetical protein